MMPSYPVTPRTPVVRTVGGVTFEDPYPWLREDTPEALAWQDAQNALSCQAARSWEGFERLLAAIEAEETGPDAAARDVPRQVGGRWFHLAAQPDGAGTALCVSDSVREPGRALIATGALAKERADGRPVRLAQYLPSPDGSLVAVLIGVGGDPMGVIRVLDVADGRPLPVTTPFPLHLGLGYGWTADGKTLVIPDRAADGRHRLRFVPVADGAVPRPDLVFEPDEIPVSAPAVIPQPAPDGRWLLVVTSPHEHAALILVDLQAGARRRFLPAGFAGECHGEWLNGDTYLAIETASAPRGRVVAIPVATSADTASWRPLVPKSEAVLRALGLIAGRIVLAELMDVSLRIRLFALDGAPQGEVPLPPFSSSPLVLPIRFQGLSHSEELIFTCGGFTRRPTVYRYDFAARRLEMVGEPGKELPGTVVSQRFAASKDGTRVPYFMVHRADLDLSQPQPTLVVAYGGYGLALVPMYQGHLAPFLRAGGVYVQANLRGGGEYGKAWHDGGRFRCKQNTFDDLYAVAEHLIAAGISVPERLAIQGASNGGLTAGAAINQRPDLWRVVVPVIPVLDVLDDLGSGALAEEILSYARSEYGDFRDPEFAAVMAAYAPIQNIRDGVAYPAVCAVYGEKDPGCTPRQGRSYIARLQAANRSEQPILLRVWKDQSHGAYGRANVERNAEWLSFVMQQLGMTMPAAGETGPSLLSSQRR